MANQYLELTDWRRRVAAMFEAWRAAGAHDAEGATVAFRAAKDDLFREHPQSPLPASDHGSFRGLSYWPYDPAYRMTAPIEPDAAVAERGPHDEIESPGPPLALPSSGAGGISFRRIGRVRLSGPLDGQKLSVFWMDAYGGGLFLPLRDATSGSETYGAGRYLLDTIKSADHGADPETGELTLDFNMAFHPSCAYDPRWSCPLAPLENNVHVPIPVGERLDQSGHR